MNNFRAWIDKNPGLAVAFGVVAAVLCVLFGSWYLMHQSVINAGNQKQQVLIAQYNQTTNVLSTCVKKTKQSVGTAQAETKALDQIITNAVTGRYNENSLAQPGAGNPLFSAIVEAYPDLTGLNRIYERVLDTINGCQSDFQDAQAELQAGVSNFESWRTGSWTTRNLGGEDYPSSALAIVVAGKTVSGEAALNQMRIVVAVGEAQDARDTGILTNDDPFAVPTTP